MCEGKQFSLSIAIKSLFVIMTKAKTLSKEKLLKIAKIKIVARLLAK